MDAIELLTSDHDEVKELFKQYEALGDDDVEGKRRIAEQAIQALMVHERLEEDIFYPVFKQAADKKGKELVAESKEEHHVVDLIIDELQAVDLQGEEFDAKFTVLMENVKHHIEEEEGEMFPDARKLLGDELVTLGEDMAELKQSLMAQVSPEQDIKH